MLSTAGIPYKMVIKKVYSMEKTDLHLTRVSTTGKNREKQGKSLRTVPDRENTGNFEISPENRENTGNFILALRENTGNFVQLVFFYIVIF